jgi:uracil phosphoribosyltransferase
MTSNVQVVDHPLVASRLRVMRDEKSDNATFRSALRELTTMLVYEATRDVATCTAPVTTPIQETQGTVLGERIVFVPILRAGLGMLQSATDLIPIAEIGFVGMARNEETHEPDSYMESLPSTLSDSHVVVLDPMLATGGSLVACLDALRRRGASTITVICVLAAPEGLERVNDAHDGVRIVTASVDERLNDNAYIVPGLGDAGDRQFGAV